MSCTASVCICGGCGTFGKGDRAAALKRAQDRITEAQKRDAEHALRRDVIQTMKAPRE